MLDVYSTYIFKQCIRSKTVTIRNSIEKNIQLLFDFIATRKNYKKII